MFRELRCDYLEPISYYGKYFDNKFHMAKHAHAYLEIMYCTSGQFNFEVAEQGNNNQSVFNVYKVRQNELLFIDSNVYHRIFLDKADKAHILNLEFEVKPKSADKFNISGVLQLDYSKLIESSKGLKKIAFSNKGYSILTDAEDIGVKMQQLLYTLSSDISSFESAFAARIGIYELFVEIGKCSESTAISSGITYIKKALEYIKKNFSAKISIDDIADYVGINKSYLQRLFKSSLGTSVYKKVCEFRVDKCKKLLITSNMPINTICNDSGFENRQQLNYEFKAFVGESPSVFRNKNSQKVVDHYADDHDSVFIAE